jgi:ABC-type bacteriocin/lantibiotic exporter with double-glycine peptidase domain
MTISRLPLLALAVALGGCASPSCPAPTGERAVFIPVPAEAQRGDADCGLACLGALLRHHGLALDDAARRALPPSAEGLRAGAIRDYLVSRGFRAHLVHGTLDAAPPAGLLRVLSAGVPALVALSTPDRASSHFVLVTGFDPDTRELVLMDPALGNRRVPFDRFALLWTHAERLMLVAAPASSSRTHAQ